MINDVKELISIIEGSKRQEKKTSLDKMFALCDLFDNPQDGVPFIHVGGTNGKGSTLTYIKTILMEAGYNVGAFISPYVVCFNERISLNNTYISDEDLLFYGKKILNKCAQLQIDLPPFFDFVTMIAFLYFKDLYQAKKVDYVILEVGMGGIYDSTNVCKPLLSLITNVDYDHMSVLGNTLGEIWQNKLGILKEDTPFICYHSEYDYLVNDQAREKNAKNKLKFISKSDCVIKEIGFDYTIFDYLDYKNLKIKLLGPYQVENAALAIEAIKSLNEYHLLKHDVNEDAIRNGLEKAFWPGRLEIVSKKPLIILDGAHNVDAILRLIEFIKHYKFNKPLRLVIAISANKEVDRMIHLIEGLGSEVVYTEFNYKRSDLASHLYNISNHPNKLLIENEDDVLDYIKDDLEHDNLLFGSLYFVSEMRKKFK